MRSDSKEAWRQRLAQPASNFVRGEEIRPQIAARVEKLRPDELLNLGTNASNLTHQLAAIGTATKHELEVGIRITADHARKAWTDLRAVSRMLGIPFIITLNRAERAVLRRHPDYSGKQIQEWLTTYAANGGRIANFSVASKTPSEPKPTVEITDELRLIKTRLERLEKKLGDDL